MIPRFAVCLTVLGLILPIAPTSGQQPGEIAYHDESALPSGPIGERITSLIETLNGGDPEGVRRFLEQECTEEFRDVVPMERHLEVFAFVRRQWGKLSFHSIRTYTPARTDETVVIVKDENFGAWRALTLRFEAGGGRRLANLGFDDARTPTNVEEPSLTETEMLAEVEALLGRVCERDVFSGTALVARGEEVLFAHACGEASKRFHVPNDLETRFNLGSMNKMFTATAIMQLVEEGIVSLDDPIGRYVDETWLPAEITDRVTVHHLLTHTSGLGSYFNARYREGSRQLFRRLDDYKPLVRDEELAFEPGTDWRYSNTGMFLLGVVLESATGVDYFDYVRRHIYEPAGMRHSDSYEMDRPVENLAIGYDPAPDSEWGYENNLFKHVIKGGPAGGGFSTVGDLHRFVVALTSGALVSPESLETLWSDHFDGYGFRIRQGPNGKVVGHGGGFAGISASLDIMPDRDYIVAVLSNYGRAAGPVAGRVASLIGRVPATSE